MATEHSEKHYIRIWLILLGLLVVSVVGPMLGHPVLTLVTAFGIAAVKAFLVAKNFMHLNTESRWVRWILGTMLAFMAVFFWGVAPDVMHHDGRNWENVSAKEAVKKGAHPAPAHHSP